ncbi:MAG: nucleotidyltransferase domain-containing protein [Armatimonadota bacterium]
MELTTKLENDDVLFVISDYPLEYEAVFQEAYYELVDGAYVKRFSKDLPNMSKIKRNWEFNAETMFAQMGHFAAVDWEAVLMQLIPIIDGNGIDWWLTGSCASCVHGVPLKPHDIDLMLSSKDIDRVNELFADYLIEPIRSTNGWVVDYFGVLYMGARVDLAFDPVSFVDDPELVDFGPYAMANLQEVCWNGHHVKVPPLELQLQVNKRRGRLDRAEAISQFIDCR